MVSGYARLGSVIRHHMSGGLIIIQLNMFLAIYHDSSQHVRVWTTCHHSERYTSTKKDEWLPDHHPGMIIIIRHGSFWTTHHHTDIKIFYMDKVIAPAGMYPVKSIVK